MSSMIDRRSFLEAAAFAAAPLILSSRALGRPRAGAAVSAERVAPGDRLGVGFIGMGIQNRFHLDTLLKNPAVQVLAVCDVDTTRREHSKKKVEEAYAAETQSGAYSGCKAFIDSRELIAMAGVDAVVIGTPDHWHVYDVVWAAKAKKDIYVEKPLSHTIAEAKLMMDVVRENKVVLQTGSQQRTEYDGRFRTACEYIRSGRIGRVLTVQVGIGTSSVACDLAEEAMEPGLDWDRWLGPAPVRAYNAILSPRGVHGHYPMWRLYKEYSGGLLTDWGAHHFDIVQWALGMDESGPVEVMPPPYPEATFGGRLRYANDVIVEHGGSFGITFNGTKGSLFVSRDALTCFPGEILKEPLTDKDARLPAVNGHMANWLECIKTRNKPVCDVEVGARSITVSHLLNLAYWHKRKFVWDPKTWEFPGDEKANALRDHERRKGFEMPV